MNNLTLIEKCIKSGLNSLSKSLLCHWPLPNEDKKNEISEANIVIHTGSEFLKCGYSVFSEYRINKNEHYDLVAINHDLELSVIIECKRYLSSDSGVSFDIKRMTSVETDDNLPSYGAVIVLCRNESIHKWWVNGCIDSSPSSKHSSLEWQAISQLINDHLIRTGSVKLAYHGKSGNYHVGLYGIFEITP